jgi:hypothetical protein
VLGGARRPLCQAPVFIRHGNSLNIGLNRKILQAMCPHARALHFAATAWNLKIH